MVVGGDVVMAVDGDSQAGKVHKYCACHEICTSRSTKCCTCHEICTSRSTKCCTCHEIRTSRSTQYHTCHDICTSGSTKYCACHELCTSRSTNHRAAHKICTSRSTKYSACYEIYTSRSFKILHLPPNLHFNTKYCTCHEICTSRSTKHCACHELCTSGHKVLRLPRNLHFKAYNILRLPKKNTSRSTKHRTCHNVHFEVHKARRLPRNLHFKVHKNIAFATKFALQGPQSTAPATKPALQGPQSTAPGQQSIAPATISENEPHFVSTFASGTSTRTAPRDPMDIKSLHPATILAQPAGPPTLASVPPGHELPPLEAAPKCSLSTLCKHTERAECGFCPCPSSYFIKYMYRASFLSEWRCLRRLNPSQVVALNHNN